MVMPNHGPAGHGVLLRIFFLPIPNWEIRSLKPHEILYNWECILIMQF